ncbi:membrane protein [Microbacterium sp. CH12i]|uniref:DUF1206 domain-containing protein n=1 Tax=Microbacterium sp. CH12i TaxID=1479651 RepID=UPI000460E53A|nr:DUF1206 domain-containing protein [Microbacterium sp. CH12i]KDA04926.1 membrane protein [Microbacterium sp. CH12i]
MNPKTSAASTARAAQGSDAFRVLARVGYIVLGILHVLIGAIAISITTGGGGGDADQGGAMQQIQKSSAGVVLLWIIVVGLFALAIWQIAEAVTERDPDTKKKWGYRIKFIGTAFAYLAIAGTALTYALGGQSQSSQSSQSLSAQLLAVPAGVALLVLLGLIVVAIGIAFIVRGITKAFKKNLNLPTGATRSGIVTFGVAGYIAKGIAVAVAGVLFVVAALTHNPEAAGGLDSALRTLAGLPFGTVILWTVGAGLILYGLFCFARARYARM